MMIDVKSSGKMTIGVTFGKAPVKLSVSYSRACEHKVALTTKYMPGAHYSGYQPHLANKLEKCWSVL